MPAVIAAIAARGFGANVVSRGEWAAARRAGIPNERITLEGIGKTPADLRAAVRAAVEGRPLRWVAIESPEEAEALAAIVRAAGAPPIDVLYRLNPDVVPETLAGLAVGAGGSKFGMTETEISPGDRARRRGRTRRAVAAARDPPARRVAARARWTPGARRSGGRSPSPRCGAARSRPSTPSMSVAASRSVPLGEAAPTPERFAREVPALLEAIPGDRRPARLAIEPGRALVARSGWLVARVLHVRERADRQVILDAGMTELIRPALYGARHPIHALGSARRRAADLTATRVEGPICESTDSLGVHDLPALRRGDLVAIADAGAYAASLGSTYNGRPRPPQVLLTADGTLSLGRRRGSI